MLCFAIEGSIYRRPPSSYVLHRVIKVRDDDYVILGDNCVNKEYGIKDSDIIGVMTEYVHNGKKHTVNEFGYRLYSHIWVDFSAVRVLLLRVKLKLKRLKKHEE